MKAFVRERQSRKEAEKIIESKSLELHYVNTELIESNKNLEERIIDRTKDIENSKKDLIAAKMLAEKANIAKSEFLSNMTHELRTPLNGVIGLSELVLNEELSADVHDMLENIKFSANHLNNVINEILDFSKIEAGKITFENIEFSLPNLVNGIHKNLQIATKNKSIDLKLEYDTKLPSRLRGDPVKLNQILNNIIGNALKFTNQGFVKITCQLNSYDKDTGVVDIEFRIKDTGIGIKKDQIDGIFKSFTQSDSSITRKFGGTGLGLTITKNFIELQGGSINVNSKYGFGTEFIFTIPTTFVSYIDKDNIKSNWNKYKPLNISILVVDDMVINQMVVGKILNNWGVEVDIASSGQQALQLLRKHKYDLVLMDMQMPEMSGCDTTKIIRKDLEFASVSNIPIIAFTANAFDDSRQLVIEAGMNSFISKPVEPEKLYNAIIQVLKKQNIDSDEIRKSI